MAEWGMREIVEETNQPDNGTTVFNVLRQPGRSESLLGFAGRTYTQDPIAALEIDDNGGHQQINLLEYSNDVVQSGVRSVDKNPVRQT